MGIYIWTEYYCNLEGTWIEISDHKNNPEWPLEGPFDDPDCSFKNYPVYDALEECSEPEDTFPPLATASMKETLTREHEYSCWGGEIIKKYRWAYLKNVLQLVDSRSFNKRLNEYGETKMGSFRYENSTEQLDRYKDATEKLFKNYKLEDIIILWLTDVG